MPVKTLISKLLPFLVAEIPKPGYVPVVPTFSTATSYCGASWALNRQPIRHFLIDGSLLMVTYQ